MADNRYNPWGYDPYDARNYDAGGFGFGGTSGSGGGFGAGGGGPQTGGYGSQANYGQGGRYEPEAEQHRPSWLDSFPHSFHGWGPNAPDYGPDPQRNLGYTPRSDHVPRQDYGRHSHRNYQREAERWGDEHPDDAHYRSWREQQMQALDDEYHAWREEGRTKFNEDFNAWRDKRRSKSAASATAKDYEKLR